MLCQVMLNEPISVSLFLTFFTPSKMYFMQNIHEVLMNNNKLIKLVQYEMNAC